MPPTSTDPSEARADAPATVRRRWPLPYLFLLAAVLAVGGAWLARWATAPPVIVENGTSGDGRLSPSFVEPAEVDRLIAVYEDRVDQTTNALDFRTLGYLYLEQARLGGDVTRYAAAQEAFSRAVSLFPSDPGARVGLASALYSLHEFEEARSEALLVLDATGRADALAVVVDADVALGDYEAAAGRLDELAARLPEEPAVMVRLSEWARLDGDGRQASRWAEWAVEASADGRNPRRRAWYQGFAAQTMLHLGRYDQGLTLTEEAHEADPDSIGVLVTRARLLASTGDRAGAIEIYQDVVERAPDPAHLVELHDLHLAMGDEAAAADVRATIESTADLGESRGVYDRVIAQFLADHRLDPERAVDIARAELEERRDVGAHDTLAWALHAAGSDEEAWQASEEALGRGTLDAAFLYHAGVIAASLGEDDEAEALLSDALDLSPVFRPLQAERAREALESLSNR